MENIRIQNIEVTPANGLRETLNQMQHLERLSYQNPRFVKFVIDNFSSNCVACVPGKVWNYMKKNFTYTPDDPYDERLTAPYILVNTKKGDCDDFSLFAKTCLDIAGGWITNYMLLGKKRNEFTHIVCFAHRGRNLLGYVDPVIVDGASDEFNVISDKYIYKKII